MQLFAIHKRLTLDPKTVKKVEYERIEKSVLCSVTSVMTLCDLMDCSPPGSSVHGILQARLLEWLAVPSSRRSPDPGIEPTSLMFPALAGGFFTTNATWEGIVHENSNQKRAAVLY